MGRRTRAAPTRRSPGAATRCLEAAERPGTRRRDGAANMIAQASALVGRTALYAAVWWAACALGDLAVWAAEAMGW